MYMSEYKYFSIHGGICMYSKCFKKNIGSGMGRKTLMKMYCAQACQKLTTL